MGQETRQWPAPCATAGRWCLQGQPHLLSGASRDSTENLLPEAFEEGERQKQAETGLFLCVLRKRKAVGGTSTPETAEMSVFQGTHL